MKKKKSTSFLPF